MGRNNHILLPFVGVLCVLMCLMACGTPSDAERERIDSLNMLAYHAKYRSLGEAERYVDEVLAGHVGTVYRDGVHEAWLNKGDVLGMRMDYDSAQVCYQKVLAESNNDLLCSVADVDMMSVCLMTAQNKEFYDYRSDAHERFANVTEAVDDMTPHQLAMWNTVQTQYHFVSINYFLKMRQDDGIQEEFRWLDEHQDLFVADTTQWAAYLFLKSLYISKDQSDADGAEEMQRNLLRLLSFSRQKDYIYFEASALNGLARTLVMGGEVRPSRQVFLREQLGDPHQEEGQQKDDDLGLLLVLRALTLARQYGNAFVETTALVTLSDYYLRHQQDSLALVQMEQALELINEHHRKMCRRQNVKPERLNVYVPKEGSSPAAQNDSLSIEMRWIANPAVGMVPDWVAMVREQLSIVYGAMGKKAESDYNHNIYFDILDATRQDLRVQQEEEHLKREERLLNMMLWGLGLAIVVLFVLFYEYTRRSRAKYHERMNKLSRLIEVCRMLPSALLREIEDEEGLDVAVHEIADKEVEALFPQVKGTDWTTLDVRTLKGLDREMMGVLQVFYNWMKQKGLQYMQMTEQQRVLESETYLYGKRLEENKRQYVEKLTSMSIVNGITPFLDRALHEVYKLNNGREESDAVVRERLQYLSELIDKINEYNDVLGHWVKIRQGEVTLHVENFALQPLFDTLRRGMKAFETKHLMLEVTDTESIVKADKALTLFMMNTLLDNARKYTPEGGRVTLSASETDEYVEVAVSDTGHGMSPEDVETLNNSKVYDSSKIGTDGSHAADIRRNKGFGFGLMNCKGIIGKYKKTNPMFAVCAFGVESEVGKGSRFFFRLPKGVLRAVMGLLLLMAGTHRAMADDCMRQAGVYADSLYAANVTGNHEQAILYADSAIQCFNRHYREQVSQGKQLMALEGEHMAELEWWKSGIEVDYELMISIRNEVAIAALALNRGSLYHYNNEVFTRLYKMASTDPALEAYCNDIRMANRNKKTTVIVLGALLFLVVAVYFFLHYHNIQLLIFNLRQFIQLNNNVFTAEEEELSKVLCQGLADIKPVDTIGVMLPRATEAGQFDFSFAGRTEERSLYENMMQTAYSRQEDLVSSNGRFRAYPLAIEGVDDGRPIGALGVGFAEGKLSDEEALIMRQVVQFMSIHTYFSHHKVSEMHELLELRQDERLRIAGELQKVYVRNQIMDNSLSTLKHETMYYPNRIKQLVDAALSGAETHADRATVADVSELLNYYKEVFSILSACAEKQVEMVLFKRTRLTAQTIGEMVRRSFVRQGKKAATSAKIQIAPTEGVTVQGDQIFLQMLIDNIISLFFEHHSGGDLLLDFAVSEGFAKFAFTDTAYRYEEADLSKLFYIDNVKYDAKTDTLSGTQYLICRQIIREHDAYSPRRGCRIYVENTPDGRGSTFVFTLPSVS